MTERDRAERARGSERRPALGRYGEDLAVRLLEERGYVVVERNWRTSVGEIDIVAREGECWAFVEVKTRHGHATGYAEDAMTQRKATRLTELGQLYLGEHALEEVDWRIDLLAIELGPRGELARVNLVRAVTADRVG